MLRCRLLAVVAIFGTGISASRDASRAPAMPRGVDRQLDALDQRARQRILNALARLARDSLRQPERET